MKNIINVLLLTLSVLITTSCKDGNEWETYSPKDITVNPSSVTLEVGETTSLTATASPQCPLYYDFKWHSNDETIAKVSNIGVVTAIATGETFVECSLIPFTTLTRCLIIVKEATITGIELSDESKELYPGQEYQLSASVLPEVANQSVEWRTSNPDVATVSATGRVVAVSEGNATITCTSTSNKDIYATCSIVVSNANVISMRFEQPFYYLFNSNSIKLTPIFYPVYTTIKDCTWSSSDPTIVSVKEDGTVSAKNIGSATITCTSTASPDKYATCTVRVSGTTYGSNNHHYIDLGLTSGTLWAMMNVGAQTEIESGSWIAAGGVGSSVDWGGKWTRPTKAQFEELMQECTVQWTTINGVNGCIFKSKKNNNSIFWPIGHYLTFDHYGNNPSDYYYALSIDNDAVRLVGVYLGARHSVRMVFTPIKR